MSFVQKLRKKPVHIKERIMIVSLLCLFALVFFGWILSFNYRGFDVSGIRAFVVGAQNSIGSKDIIFDSQKTQDLFQKNIGYPANNQ